MTDSICPTCNRSADDGYLNFDARERCIDPVHDDGIRWENDDHSVGERVRYSSVVLWGDGKGYRRASFGSGIYLGVALDEEDGVPYHYFRGGEINGTKQGSHGFAADPGTAPTTTLTPTELIRRACVFCGGEVTSTNSDTDFCRECFYGGRHLQRRLTEGDNLLGQIEGIDEVAAAAVWHTGGGCFNLAVTLADGRLLTPSIGYRDEDNGSIWPESGIPESDDDRWAMIVSESKEAWDEWDEERLWTPQALYTNAELVEAIRDIAAKPDAALVQALRDAEENEDAEAEALALNDLAFRLGLALDQTERGLTAEASEKIAAFVQARLPLANYVANVIGENLIDAEMPPESNPTPIRPSDEGLLVLYGDAESGVTVVVAATSREDAERRIVATFGDDGYIDDLDLSIDQRPLSINYTAGRVDDEEVARQLLAMDAEKTGGNA